MALTRPTLLSQVAFDATQQQTFKFVAQSSSQITANLLIIRNNDTNDIVYQEKQETFKYEHIVNAEELENGVYYNATITVFDNEDNQSPESIPIQFWCYTTPTLQFTNINNNDLINNASFNFEFEYNQKENEPISSYIVSLFNSSKVEISNSGNTYVQNGNPIFSSSYQFVGFSNNTEYFVQITGITLEGTIISSPMINFNVQYINPDLYTTLQLVNNCDEGYITITSNIVIITGTSNPSPPIYIDNKEVDLTNPDSWVNFGEGFNINGNFLARAWFRNPNNYSTILQFSNTVGQIIKLNYMTGYENVDSTEMESFVTLIVTSITGFDYYIYSNYVNTLDSNSQYVVYLTKNNDLYNLQLLTV